MGKLVSVSTGGAWCVVPRPRTRKYPDSFSWFSAASSRVTTQGSGAPSVVTPPHGMIAASYLNWVSSSFSPLSISCDSSNWRGCSSCSSRHTGAWYTAGANSATPSSAIRRSAGRRDTKGRFSSASLFGNF
eukprot:4508417-Prymnesium_polylepis.3